MKGFVIAIAAALLIPMEFAVGQYYKPLKSREGQHNKCKRRLAPSIFKRYCNDFTQCENDKGCRSPKGICVCHDYCGKVCIDPTTTCYDGYCKNGGACSDFQGRTICSCPPNFTGTTCEVNVDECQVRLTNPCKNGATCTDYYGGYECRCSFGWEGFDCTINKDDCVSSPCLSGGTCVDKVGRYSCICPPGKTGHVCQFDDECYLQPCYGSAKCLTDPFGHYSCLCPRGWTGKNCSIDIDGSTTGSSSSGSVLGRT